MYTLNLYISKLKLIWSNFLDAYPHPPHHQLSESIGETNSGSPISLLYWDQLGMFAPRLVAWFAGWLVGWLVGWFVECLLGWLVGWLLNSFEVMFLTNWFGWLAGLLMINNCTVVVTRGNRSDYDDEGSLVGLLRGWLVGWLAAL